VIAAGFDVEKVREDFPVLKQRIHGKPLVYLDNAATAQKPFAVIDAIRKFHEVDCANIHRGVHELSQRSTAAYEETRSKAKRFLNARAKNELIFVRGATEGINLVASLGPQEREGRRRDRHLGAGAPLQHRALADAVRREGRQAAGHSHGRPRRAAPRGVRKASRPRTRMVAVGHVSNAWAPSIPCARSSRWRTAPAPWR
jgi:cysteine desulfurase/selenocysteine lyase